MKIFLINSWCCLFSLVCFGQDVIGMKEFLASARYQESVTYQQQKASFLKEISHKLPLIEKLEVRTETNDFDLTQQEYLLRVSPNSRHSIKAQNQYQETNRHLADAEQEVALGRAIKERYDILLEFIFTKRLLAVQQKRKKLLNDKVILLKRSVSLPGFDILDLIDAEDEEQENLRSILDMETTIFSIEKEIRQLTKLSKDLKIETDKLLSINDLAKIAQQIKLDKITNKELNMLSAEAYSSMMEYEWEAAKNKFSLGYIQTKYGYDDDKGFGQHFSIGIGFDIPLKGAARLDLNELQIETFEKESQYKRRKETLAQQKRIFDQQLNNLIKKHDLIQIQLTDSQAEFALKEYAQIAEASPKALLKLRENTYKKELILHQLEWKIMQTFIELMNTTGRLSQQPFKNYLSKGMEVF